MMRTEAYAAMIPGKNLQQGFLQLSDGMAVAPIGDPMITDVKTYTLTPKEANK